MNKIYKLIEWQNTGQFDIENEELTYVQLGGTHHGLQCNFKGSEPMYEIILKKCKEVTRIIQEIDSLNNNKDERELIR
jgi:hypothetical protein